MKKKNLTRKLITASIIWLVLICIVAGTYFWLDSNIQYLTLETQQKKAAYEVNKNERENIAINIKNSETAHARFINFSNSDDNNKDFFRKNAIVKKLGEITSELRAVKISFKMSPFEKYAALPSSDKVDVIYSRIEISFSALTDITAFKILKLISEKLNGTVYFKKFTLKKMGEIDSEVLLKISNGEIPSLVEGTMEFDWISIRLKDSPPETTPEIVPGSPPAMPVATPAGEQNV